MNQNPAPIRRRCWLLWLTGSVLLSFVGCKTPPPRPAATPLEAELHILLLGPGRTEKTSRIEEPGAMPVRAGERMRVAVSYNEPACTYFVWLTSKGKVVPLYPWNQDEIEVTDADQPPPTMRPSKIIFNPTTLDNGWKFDNHAGLETVLLLARRTPLGDGVRLGTLLGAVPAAKMRDRAEIGILKLDRGLTAPAAVLALHRGNAEETRETDAALLALTPRLQEHFEVIRVVRFAHEGE